MRLTDSENESQPLCVWINLQISMEDRSTTSPSTVKHFSGCALIVLLTLIVIKGLKTAPWLRVTPCAEVATHLFIGDITAQLLTHRSLLNQTGWPLHKTGFYEAVLSLQRCVLHRWHHHPLLLSPLNGWYVRGRLIRVEGDCLGVCIKCHSPGF